MSDEYEDYGASRRNEHDCERIGQTLRQALGGCGDDRMPSIIEILHLARLNIPEAKNLDLVVTHDDAMGSALAFAIPTKQEIFVKSSFVEEALADTPDARFLAFHELVHIIFHRGAPRYFRMADGNVVSPFLHDKRERAEWQADRITRATFMPTTMVANCATPLELAQKSGTPLVQAIERMKELREREAKTTPSDIAWNIALLIREGAKGTPASARLEAEALKTKLWNALPFLSGENPKFVRQCGKYQIYWDQFGKTSGCGWFIEGGKIISFFASRN